MTIHDRARAAWAEIPLLGLERAESRKVFIRGLTLPAEIGIYETEHGRKQPVTIDIDLWVREEPAAAIAGRAVLEYADVVCYEKLTDRIKALLARGHIKLVETLAEDLIELGLSDPRVERIRVRVEKPEAIPEALGVGVEIERRRR